MTKERWLITLNRVTDKLQNPSKDEKRDGPTPTEEKERQRNDD
jgi:hypothetical protein